MNRKLIFLIKDKKYKLKLRGKVTLCLFGVFFSLLIGELAVRKFIKMPLRKEHMVFSVAHPKNIPLGKQVEGLLWEPMFKTKYTTKKGDDVFRIICIGDSTTEGYYPTPGFQFISYPLHLERLLNKKIASKKIEIINAGSGGYSSYQGVAYLRQRLLEYNPDLVLSWFGIHDNVNFLFYPDKMQRLSKEDDENKMTILERSHLYLFIKNYPLLINKIIFRRPRVAPEDFYKNYEEMLRLAKGNNFEIVFIVPFYVFRKRYSFEYIENYRIMLLALAKKYGCKIIDIAPYLPRSLIADSFVDVCHADSKGNEVIARIIYSQLKDKLETLINDNRNNIVK
ncbi:MAG: SGNH/GDSL hydrolase family protein [Candidatus Omnitrophota bacterium]